MWHEPRSPTSNPPAAHSARLQNSRAFYHDPGRGARCRAPGGSTRPMALPSETAIATLWASMGEIDIVVGRRSEAAKPRNLSSSAFREDGRGRGTNGSASGGTALSYAAGVTLDRTTLNVDGKSVNLTAGMAATVEINTGNES